MLFILTLDREPVDLVIQAKPELYCHLSFLSIVEFFYWFYLCSVSDLGCLYKKICTFLYTNAHVKTHMLKA